MLCAGVLPTYLSELSGGLHISAKNLYYYFDGKTNGDWPTHDPYGKEAVNQLRNVANPNGNIFVR